MARWMVPCVVAVVAGCGSVEPPVATSTGSSSSTSTSDSASTSDAESTGVLVPDVAPEDPPPSYPAPDCVDLDLPGDPADLAATPRDDRSAEVLALRANRRAIVARQGDYEIVAADLVAIRELAPELAAVDIGCEVAPAYFFVANGSDASASALVDAVWTGSFHAWDCHNAQYGIEHRPAGQGGDVWRIDGFAFAARVFGVYDSDQVIAVYGTVDGFEEVAITPMWGAPVMPERCESDNPTIALAVDGPSLARGARTYSFAGEAIGERVFRAAPGEPLVEL